jgi:uncharacterized protein (TIGR02301 family)
MRITHETGHRDSGRHRPDNCACFNRAWRGVTACVTFAVIASLLSLTAANAQSLPDQRPYDDKLLRLSEILGSVHFLRELCGGTDGMLWRDRMTELMDAEGSSSLRRVRLTRAFNTGYRSYSRTYSSCTPTAQTAITKFMAEGADIAETLVRATP